MAPEAFEKPVVGLSDVYSLGKPPSPLTSAGKMTNYLLT
jgi:hypothetical protein